MGWGVLGYGEGMGRWGWEEGFKEVCTVVNVRVVSLGPYRFLAHPVAIWKAKGLKGEDVGVCNVFE